jgi:hypothetical protein
LPLVHNPVIIHVFVNDDEYVKAACAPTEREVVMWYQQLQDLASLHLAELRQVGAARRMTLASQPGPAVRRRMPTRRPASLRARVGWRLVAIGLSLAVRPPASQRLPAG